MTYIRVIKQLEQWRDQLRYTAQSMHESDAAQKYPEQDALFQGHFAEQIEEYDAAINVLSAAATHTEEPTGEKE